MAYVKDSWRLYKVNAKPSFLFEVIYKILFLVLVFPLEMGLLNVAMLVSGNTYIAESNMGSFLRSPVTWVVLILMVIVIAVYALFEFCALIILMHAGHSGYRPTMRQLFALAFDKANDIVKKGNRFAIVFVLLMVPFTGIILYSNALTSFHIPEFITEYIDASNPLSALYLIGLIALCYVVFCLAFSLHYYTLGGRTFRESRAASKTLLKKRKWYFLWRLAIWSLLTNIAVYLIFLFLSLAVVIPLLRAGAQTHVIFTAVGILIYAVDFIFSCLLNPLVFAFLTQMFYRLCALKGEPLLPDIEPPVRKPGRLRRAGSVLGSVVVITFIILAGTTSVSTMGLIYFQALNRNAGDVTVTAHRGDSAEYPENTLEAFQGAIDRGADWVELDVQQTADGVLVIMHDSNLKRTTGINRNIWDVTYDEIKNLDNGSWFVRTISTDMLGDDALPARTDFSDVRICTLEQALQMCKGKIKMNIEVKPDGHNDHLEEKTVDLINEYGMADQVAVASINYDSLVKVKEYDPSITTMYDMLLGYGNLGDMPDVDIFSVDEAFVTPMLVAEVHEDGKKIFAWTVNETDNMMRLYFDDIDSLVTDQLTVAEQICG